MADDGGTQGAAWPLPKFHFRVSIPDVGDVSFQEITGLDSDVPVIEYRAGNSKSFQTVKMPGIAKYGTVVMKKGIFTKDNSFWAWFEEVKMNLTGRRAVTIELLDETGKPTMVWTLTNAWPTKISGTDLKSDGNEVAVETVEFAHEGLTIANA
ncbi:phage tail protein [Tropicibacter sp. S64]|uniref:phage tail protein n=1 Tax=Tropicibacter sp. S64 TaxID=3415122 RepID=UPI003C7A2D20